VLYGVIKGTEKMVEMKQLHFVRAFKNKKKKKKRLSDAARKEKWKNPTPRERRRRRYWRNLQAAARQCAKVAAAPRGTIESQAPVQPEIYQPTFMLWVPATPMALPAAPLAMNPTMPSPVNTAVATPSPMCLPSMSPSPLPLNIAGFQLMHQGIPSAAAGPVEFITGAPTLGHFHPASLEQLV